MVFGEKEQSHMWRCDSPENLWPKDKHRGIFLLLEFYVSGFRCAIVLVNMIKERWKVCTVAGKGWVIASDLFHFFVAIFCNYLLFRKFYSRVYIWTTRTCVLAGYVLEFESGVIDYDFGISSAWWRGIYHEIILFSKEIGVIFVIFVAIYPAVKPYINNDRPIALKIQNTGGGFIKLYRVLYRYQSHTIWF